MHIAVSCKRRKSVMEMLLRNGGALQLDSLDPVRHGTERELAVNWACNGGEPWRCHGPDVLYPLESWYHIGPLLHM